MSKTDDGQTQVESFAGSVTQFAKDVALLIREDLESARDEMVEKAKTAGMGAGMLSGSAVAGLLTLACLTVVLIMALSLILAPWIAALIVTVLWALVTAALAMAGKRKFQDVGSPLPEKTIRNVKRELS